MTQKLTPLILVAWLILMPIGQSTAAYPNPVKEAQQAEKIKAGIAKLGLGKEARVKLKLKGKTKLSGYISEIGETSFVVTDLKTATPTTLAYSHVAQVQGNNLSTRTKIIIGVSIVVAIIIVAYNVRGAFCDGC